MKKLLPLLLAATLPAAAQPMADFSGRWVWREVDGHSDKQFRLNLVQQGDTVSGEWSGSIKIAFEENSRPGPGGKVRGKIRNGRLTLEYCSEEGGNSRPGIYPPCPQYERFLGYAVLQSDGTLMQYQQTGGTRPRTTYRIWQQYTRQ